MGVTTVIYNLKASVHGRKDTGGGGLATSTTSLKGSGNWLHEGIWAGAFRQEGSAHRLVAEHFRRALSVE